MGREETKKQKKSFVGHPRTQGVILVGKSIFLTGQRPAQWKVVLSLCGDTSERHCEKASSSVVIFRATTVFGAMRVLISDVLFCAPKWNFLFRNRFIFCTQDRRFVFECRCNKRFKSTHLWEPQRVWCVVCNFAYFYNALCCYLLAHTILGPHTEAICSCCSFLRVILRMICEVEI